MSRVNYAGLACHLSALPYQATCADLAVKVQEYLDQTGNDRTDLVEAIKAEMPDADWLFQGLNALGGALKRENPRFDIGLFMEWCLGEIPAKEMKG